MILSIIYNNIINLKGRFFQVFFAFFLKFYGGVGLGRPNFSVICQCNTSILRLHKHKQATLLSRCKQSSWLALGWYLCDYSQPLIVLALLWLESALAIRWTTLLQVCQKPISTGGVCYNPTSVGAFSSLRWASKLTHWSLGYFVLWEPLCVATLVSIRILLPRLNRRFSRRVIL